MKATFKVICVLPFVFLLTSLSPNQVKPTDTIPEKIEFRAKQLTDKQIDSIYHGKLITPLVDALKNDFQALRTHMDSLNAENIILSNENKKADFKRDSVAALNAEMSKQNNKLLLDNQELLKQNRVFIILPNILMVILIFMWFRLLVIGVVIGVKREIKDENNNDR